MIADGEEIESGLIGGNAQFDEFGHCELFVSQLETNLTMAPGRYL